MAIKISLIIPVYNDEKHIAQCLESAVNQIHCPHEIIVIDDGSRDSSSEIAEEYRRKYAFVKVIHHSQNQGLMRSWHHGVTLAEGEYIAFLDSDDWVNHRYLEELAGGAEAGAEIVCCNHNRVYGQRMYLQKERITAGFYDHRKIRETIFPVLLNDGTYLGRGLTPHRCGKLFRKGLLLNNLHYCDPEISYGEDLNIFFPVMQDCSSICVLDDREGLYFYRQNENSMIHTHKKDMLNQILRLRNQLFKSMQEKSVYDFTEQLNRDYWCLFMEYVKNETSAGNDWAKSKEILVNYQDSAKEISDVAIKMKASDRLLWESLRSGSPMVIYLWMKLYRLVRSWRAIVKKV